MQNSHRKSRIVIGKFGRDYNCDDNSHFLNNGHSVSCLMPIGFTIMTIVTIYLLLVK